MVKHNYLRNVTSLVLDGEKCIGCGICQTVCPHGVFDTAGSKATLADKDACIECGACALNCPTNALSVNPGVGCAAAFIKGWLTGREPSCGCEGDGASGAACC